MQDARRQEQRTKNTGRQGAVHSGAHETRPTVQGAADADVQAEKDQAKEGAWELFTG